MIRTTGRSWARPGVALVIAAVAGGAAAAGATSARDLVLRADRLLAATDPTHESAQEALALYQEAARLEPANAEVRLKLASGALSVGGRERRDPRSWYEVGRGAAQRAVELAPDNAEAHFLLAALRGQIASQTVVASPLLPRDLEQLLQRALTLNPRHARALHMMGMLLLKTPPGISMLLRGKRADVEGYLVRAVEADPNFAQARLDLAAYYLSQQPPRRMQCDAARAHAQAVVEMTQPTYPRSWREQHRPAAEALLRGLADRGCPR